MYLIAAAAYMYISNALTIENAKDFEGQITSKYYWILI